LRRAFMRMRGGSIIWVFDLRGLWDGGVFRCWVFFFVGALEGVFLH
jgi:hypothetical protein